MKTIDELRKEVEDLRARASKPALTPDMEERAQLRADREKALAKIADDERRAREALDAELFDDLEGKHAGLELTRIDTEAGMIVMRTPSIAKSRHFQQVALKGKLSPDAIEDFVKPCIVHPNEEQLEEWIERYPLLTATLCQFAQELGSAGAERRGKK